MLYDIEKRNWMCIVTYGFSPSPRWGVALAVSQQNNKIFIFGGANHAEGFCSNKLFCLELSSSAVKGFLSETRQCLDEVGGLMRNFVRNQIHK